MKKRISNLSIIFIVILALLAVIGVFTVIKIQKNHEDKLMYSMTSTVEYYAKQCYLDDICKDTITLSVLYENNYLTEVINPVTKEVISPDLKIEYKDGRIVVDWDSVI